MANATLTNRQYLVVGVNGVDRLGSSAVINTLTAVSSVPAVASIEVFGAPANQNFKLIGLTAGSTVITINAKNTAGTALPVQTINVTVTAELAVSISVSIGSPLDQ